jgi:hypothetical protein
MEREAESTAVLGKSDHTSALQEALRYPLVDALTNRRSRRFSLGATLPGGALAYKSKRAPLPLTTSEEAALAFAAAGINGFALGDLPFQEGNLPEGGGGNVIATLTGRTGASADAVHSTALFVINDSGTYLLKRPQDFTLDEIEALARLAEDHKLEQVYEKMRIKIRDGRTVIEKKVPLTFPFNKWSTNLAGSTYFLPVCELTSMYINVLLSTFDEQMAMFLLDERAKFQPAGIKRFGQSQGGRLHDNPDDSRVASILAIETIIVEFMLAEQAFMVHNLSLMEQAMGLGGWTHFASAQETTWFEVLGFKIGSQRLSQIMNAGPLRRFILRLKGADRSYPHPLGLTLNGVDLIKPFCPPYYRSMEEAVLAFLKHKQTSVTGAALREHFPGSWKDPAAVQASIPKFSDECIAATIAYCTYVYETYGKFPAYFGPLRTTLAHQAHHLDLDFYDKFYHPGAYTETQKSHHHRWHGAR